MEHNPYLAFQGLQQKVTQITVEPSNFILKIIFQYLRKLNTTIIARSFIVKKYYS